MPLEDLDNRDETVGGISTLTQSLSLFLGGVFTLAGAFYYVYQLSIITELFVKDFDPRFLLLGGNITVFSIAYLGTMVLPTFLVMIGIGFWRRKRWLPQVVEIGFVLMSLFVLNTYVVSDKFGVPFSYWGFLAALVVFACIVGFVIWKKEEFARR